MPEPTAMALLHTLGWLETDEKIEFPDSIPETQLSEAINLLQQSGTSNGPAPVEAPSGNAAVQFSLEAQEDMTRRLRAQMTHVHLYERADLQVWMKPPVINQQTVKRVSY